MPDFRDSVFSFPIEVFRVVAPPLEAWRIQQAPLPCWRLWWNSNRGASVRWQGGTLPLVPDRFILVAPETQFEATLKQPIERHLFIHFSLGALSWRLTNRMYAIPIAPETEALAKLLVKRLPLDPDIVFAEPLLGIALVSAVLSRVEVSGWQVLPVADLRVRRVVAAIDEDPGFAWPDETLARLAAMSVGGFVRLFRRHLGGMSPQAYITRQRLARARHLLTQSDLSIEAIAERCGYSDRSYFSTVFRREVGVPPAKYRLQAR